MESANPLPAYLRDEAPLEERVADALSRMTLEEKVALCHAQGKFSSAGVPRLGIPELWWSDGPHGVRAEINWNDWGYAGWRNDEVTVFPALTALAATWNRSLAGRYGRAVGEEARFRRKDVLLGPGLNIYRTPLNGRNFEYLGEDPYLAGELAVPYIKGVQSCGVAACAKHFALNNQEKWRGNVEVKVSERALYELYLPAFEKAVRQGGVWTVMGAYCRIWGEHACHNHRLLRDILRDEWGFDGVVVSDWGGAHDTRQCALNGLDVEMGSFTNGLTSESGNGFDDYYMARPFLESLRKGELPMSTLDEKASNILRLIFRTAMDRRKPFGSLTSPEHYATAKEIADEATVLLKNDGGLLPLIPERYRRILVVGENATRALNRGGGSSELKARDMFTPLDSIRQIYDHVDYLEGYRTGRPMYEQEETVPEEILAELRHQAIMAAPEYDAVIYIGGLNKNGFQDCEASDRYQYGLPWGQPELIEGLAEANPNLVVVCMSGNAYAMPWLPKVRALIQSWYSGTMAGPALADAIAGRVCPSGKLPFSFPMTLEECAAHAMGERSYPGIERDEPDDSSAAGDLAGADVSLGQNPLVEYLDDIFVGYRWHDSSGHKALFPFGFGLSYTTFDFSDTRISSSEMHPGESLDVSVRVTNTGSMAGSETVQLYVGEDSPAVPRPPKELKGFDKVHLASGESRALHFRIQSRDLAHYDPESHSWTASPGGYTIYLGASSADIRAALHITLTP